jgi:CheY-like chemotaxis protein
VLIDLMMPVMDGWELVRAMKRDPNLAQIPTAVVSAARTSTSIPANIRVFAKPFPVTELLQFIEAA